MNVKIVLFIRLAVMANVIVIASQLVNDTESSELDLKAESSTNVTEITIYNYTLVNASSFPLFNITSEENYTFFQDYNISYSSNFSYEENATYTPQIDEIRSPYVPHSHLCNCDLTGNSCDVNCCCDKDCTDIDKDAFYGCIPPPIVVDERHCISKTIIYDDKKIKEKTVEYNNLFCIVQDHLKQRHEYLDPPILKTANEYQKFVPTPTYSWTSTYKSFNSHTQHMKKMKAGKPLYTISMKDNILTEWKLPASIYSEHCSAFKPPKYMIDDETTCQQMITDLKQECLYNKWLKTRTYYKDFFFATPQFFALLHENTSEANNTYISLDDEWVKHPCTSNSFCVSVVPSYTCRDNESIPQLCTLDDVPLPYYDAEEDTCKNAVTKVHYFFIHNGSMGIVEANVSLETSTIDSSQKSFQQHFSVHYYGRQSTNVFRRSGNPGYLVGHPVLAGRMLRNSHLKFLLPIDTNNWLTVMGRQTNGHCSKNNFDRLPIKFGENMNTGCLYKVTYQKENAVSYCSFVQEQIMIILNGFNAPEYVGMFGNADIHNIDDWTKIQRGDEPTKPYSEASPDGACSSIVLGVDIKIVYANIGSLANPQAKIIGVLHKYLTSEHIQLPCMGPSCHVQAAHTVQLKTSVTFIDASRVAFPMYAQIPVTKISFPHDFFYPLISGYSGCRIGISVMAWPFYFVFICLIAAFKTNI